MQFLKTVLAIDFGTSTNDTWSSAGILYDSLPQIFRPVESKLKTRNLKHLFRVQGVQVGLARDVEA